MRPRDSVTEGRRLFDFGSAETGILRACFTLTRSLHGGREADGKVLSLLEDSLAFLQHYKMEALVFIAHPEYRAYRDLYDLIQSVQLDVAGPLLDAWSAVAEPIYSQGTANRDLFSGHAFGRKRDIDVVMPESALVALRNIARERGFRQLVFDENMLPLDATEEAKRATLDLTPIDKEFTFSQILPLDAPGDLLELIPDVLYPLYRDDDGIKLVVSVEPTISYAQGLDYAGLLDNTERRDGRLCVTTEASLVVNAYRFYTDFTRSIFRPKIACEIVAMATCREIDVAGLERFAQSRGLAEYLHVVRYFAALAGRDLGPARHDLLVSELFDVFGEAELAETV